MADIFKYQDLMRQSVLQGFSPQEEAQIRSFDDYIRQLRAQAISQNAKGVPLLQFLTGVGGDRLAREQSLQKADLDQRQAAMRAILDRGLAVSNLRNRIANEMTTSTENLLRSLLGSSASALTQYLLRNKGRIGGSIEAPYVDPLDIKQSGDYDYSGLV